MTEEAKVAAERSERDLRSTKLAIILFVIAVVLVVIGTAYSVINGNNNASTIQQTQQEANRAWCDALNLLTAKPVPKPANPKANPSRQQTYQLYVDFLKIRERFDC